MSRLMSDRPRRGLSWRDGLTKDSYGAKIGMSLWSMMTRERAGGVKTGCYVNMVTTAFLFPSAEAFRELRGFRRCLLCGSRHQPATGRSGIELKGIVSRRPGNFGCQSSTSPGTTTPAVRMAALASGCIAYLTKAICGEVAARADLKKAIGPVWHRLRVVTHRRRRIYSSIGPASNVCAGGSPARTVANWLSGSEVLTVNTLESTTLKQEPLTCLQFP